MDEHDGRAVATELQGTVRVFVRAAGGQRAYAQQLGVSQSALSRYLGGRQPLTRDLAQALYAAHPGLREQVARALLAAPDMLQPNGADASAAGA